MQHSMQFLSNPCQRISPLTTIVGPYLEQSLLVPVRNMAMERHHQLVVDVFKLVQRPALTPLHQG